MLISHAHTSGWGDQSMFIYPEKSMIITINCGSNTGSGNISFFLFENYFPPALIEY